MHNSGLFKSREAIVTDVIRQLREHCLEEPQRILYFGDGQWDMKCCQKLGLDFIGIDADSSGQLETLGVEPIFRDYMDREALFEAINPDDDQSRVK